MIGKSNIEKMGIIKAPVSIYYYRYIFEMWRLII